jgi:hypothetical protein
LPIPRTGIVAAIVTFLMLASSGAAYAYWSAQASLSSTANAGSISIALSNVATMQNTFGNDILIRTGNVTLTNTTVSPSTTAQPVTIGLGIVAGGSSQLAAGLDVTVWGPATASSCTDTATPTGSVGSGTWARFAGIDQTLAPGQSTTWCIRTTNDERTRLASTSGTLVIQPRVTVTLKPGTWTAVAAGETTLNTQYIFPPAVPSATSWYSIIAATGLCLEASAPGGVGATLSPSTCRVAPGQAFTLSGADANGYLTVMPKSDLSARWDGGGAGAGSPVTLQTAAGTANQAWQLQQVAAGVYQLVNKDSGLCVATSGATAVQSPCAGTAAQHFILAPVVFTISLTCTNNGNAGSKGRVAYTWSGGIAGVYTAQAAKSALDWQTIGSSDGTSASMSIEGLQPYIGPIIGWTPGAYAVQILDATGDVVATTSITVRNSGGLECG